MSRRDLFKGAGAAGIALKLARLEWAVRAFADTLEEPNFTAVVRRAEDTMALGFVFVNLDLVDDHLVPRPETGVPRMVVVFPSQSVAEEAFLERADFDLSGETGIPARAVFAGLSKLVFEIDEEVPFNFPELMRWERFRMRVAPVAEDTDGNIPWLRGEPRPPQPDETAIEAPWRLILSPNSGATWAHDIEPVARDGRRELWHTRLATRAEEDGGWRADEHDPSQRTVRAIWAVEGPNLDFPTSLTPEERRDLVISSGQDGDPAARVRARSFMLSSMGAWADLEGRFPDSAPVEAWDHVATMGRDHFVRVLTKGYLFPFGHRATLFQISERRFGRVGMGRHRDETAAFLRQKSFVVVRETVKAYRADDQPDGGRHFPFTHVRMLTRTTPLLDADRDPDGDRFWIHANGDPFPFEIEARDLSGRIVRFNAPLIFVSQTASGNETRIKELIAQQYGSTEPDQPPATTPPGEQERILHRRRRPLRGQRVAFAPPKAGASATTAFDTAELVLGARPSGSVPGFAPIVSRARVRLDAVEQIRGAGSGLVEIHPHTDYLAGGFNASGIFAKLKSPVDVAFTSSDRSGGVAAPDMKVRGLSQLSGPVGGDVNTMPDRFEPKNFFAGMTPKLLGGIDLVDVIAPAPYGNGSKVPRIVTERLMRDGKPFAVKAELLWRPDVGSAGLFKANKDTTMVLDSRTVVPVRGGKGTFHFSGELRNFGLSFFGDGPSQFLILGVRRVAFIATHDSKPDFDFEIAGVEFGNALKFLDPFRDLLKTIGGDSGPKVGVTPQGLTVSYGLAVPAIELGAWAVTNLAVNTAINLPLNGRPATLRFGLASRENPFGITYSLLRGGGFFGVGVGTSGVETMEAAQEMGAYASVNLGVAAGSVEVMLGIYQRWQTDPTEEVWLGGYYRLGGVLTLLGLVSISCHINLGLSYILTRRSVHGRASATFGVKVAFFSKSVTVTVEREFSTGDIPVFGTASVGGGGGAGGFTVLGSPLSDPVTTDSTETTQTAGFTFAETVSPEQWNEYTDAFAG